MAVLLHGVQTKRCNSDGSAQKFFEKLSAEECTAEQGDRRCIPKRYRTIGPCDTTSTAAPSKREQVQSSSHVNIPYEKYPKDLGYCSAIGSSAIENAVSLDSAHLLLNVARVQGQCVSFRVSIVKPRLAFFSFSQLPQFDTLHTQVYVLNCPALGGGIGNGSYAELSVNLQNIRSQLLTEDWYVEVAVETPNTEVELVNSATDWGPRLQLVGTFREIDPLADYTLKYDVFDKPGKAYARR